MTLFQTPEWGKLIQAVHGYPARRPVFNFADGCRTELPLSVLPRRLPFKRMLMSMPRGYGGFTGEDLAKHPHHLPEIAARLRRWCWRGRSVHIVGNPLSNHDCLESLAELAPHRRFSTMTHLLALEAGFDDLWERRFDKKARNQYRKAERCGVSARCSEQLADFQTFYQLYLASVRRWGATGPSVSFEFYERLLEIAPGAAKVWLAEDSQRRAVAAAVCFYHDGCVTLWSSAMLKEDSHLRPNDLLYTEMIRQACAAGRRLFDFGSSDGLASVEAFKQQFGPDRVEVPHAVFAHPLALAADRLVRRVRRR